MATVNDPLVYATNYYTLLNISKGIGQHSSNHSDPHNCSLIDLTSASYPVSRSSSLREREGELLASSDLT